MLGEELSDAQVTDRGLLGDRAYALVDNTDGKAATAKNPRKWPTLFDCRATFVSQPLAGTSAAPPVRITLPDGTTVTSEQADRNDILSAALHRPVTLTAAAAVSAHAASAEAYWPDIEGLDRRDIVTEFTLPPGTFFDAGTVHLLTTATLDRLHHLYPQGRFEIPRFRPNIVITPSAVSPPDETFPENAWIGHTLTIGDSVRLRIIRQCFRCVMTTLPQGDLPRDPGILRTVAQHNNVAAGVYAEVERTGPIHRGDRVSIE